MWEVFVWAIIRPLEGRLTSHIPRQLIPFVTSGWIGLNLAALLRDSLSYPRQWRTKFQRLYHLPDKAKRRIWKEGGQAWWIHHFSASLWIRLVGYLRCLTHEHDLVLRWVQCGTCSTSLQSAPQNHHGWSAVMYKNDTHAGKVISSTDK